MSIRRIQTEKLMQEVVRHLYAQGVRPPLNDIFKEVARFFSKYPAGQALPLPPMPEVRTRSDVKVYNTALAHTVENIDVLYEAVMEQVGDVLELTNSLQSHLDRLATKRRRIETRIDDYLLSLFNTDGYFFSIGDTFADLELSDVLLTSAFIDTEIGAVTLPGVSSMTRRLPRDQVGELNVSLTIANGQGLHKAISPLSGALDADVQNSVWAFEVETSEATEVIAIVTIQLGSSLNPVFLSRIDIHPYGVTPVQCFIETLGIGDTTPSFFGSKIETSLDKMSFTGELRDVAAVRFTLRKTRADYVEDTGGVVKHRYVFGAKDLGFYHQIYDNAATFVSGQLMIPDELSSKDLVIDAVSLVVDDEQPAGTEINYFVASDGDGTATGLDDLTWRPITPLGTGTSASSIVKFDGAVTQSKFIVDNPGSTDLKLIAEDRLVADLALRNPSPVLLPEADAWKICEFPNEVLPNSVKLEEGFNSVRTFFIPYEEEITTLEPWTELRTSGAVKVAYTGIDEGNDFWYGAGAGLGESNISAFAETYLDSPVARPTFLAEATKPDIMSHTWDVRIFLNGREIGWLPAHTNKVIIPWTFQQGLNHIALLIKVPTGMSAGTFNLLGDSELYDYGVVKLATWNYVSLFDMQYNETGEPFTFTIHDKYMISRRKPSTRFKVTYSTSTGNGPAGVRVRADLARAFNNPYVSPRLNKYRLRFSYATEQ